MDFRGDEIVLRKLIGNSKPDYNTGCFLWGGGKHPEGYGVVNIYGTQYDVHRLAAHIFHGLDLNSKMQSNHREHCSNKNCWAPNHLYIGSQADNLRDKANKKTHCPHGHLLEESNIWLRKCWNTHTDGTSVLSYARVCKECRRIRERNKKLKSSLGAENAN
jgi:hypothetical protein